MILLLEWLHQDSLDLVYSLQESGYTFTTIVLNDNGNLPDYMTSPYQFFCQLEKENSRALYFNQLPIPPYWQITGNNTEAEIWDMSDKRGNIFYHEPKHKRLIKAVDWLGPKEKVIISDHYDKKGFRFSKTILNQNEKPVLKQYFNKKGQEVVVENLQTGTILLNWNGKNYTFAKKKDFLHFYLKESGLSTSSIWYNSLSVPFQVSYYLQEEGQDLLFYQEHIGEEIPGNLKLILNGFGKRTQHVIVQKKDAYEKLLQLLPEEHHVKISYLDFIYPENRINKGCKEAFILTNSDQILQLELLVKSLTDVQFHIAAYTLMSDKLMAFQTYDNVSLYPNISSDKVEQLFKRCDLYLDINHGSEVGNVVRRAYEENQLILAFEETLHQPIFVATEHIFSKEKPEALIELIRTADFKQEVYKQRKSSKEENFERYRSVLQNYDRGSA